MSCVIRYLLNDLIVKGLVLIYLIFVFAKNLLIMKKLLLITFASVFSTLLFAQDVVLKTLASKGNCIVQRADNLDKYITLKAGVKIYTGDKIIITGDDSYVGLVSTDGKTVELNKYGKYEADVLVAELATGKSSLTEKYVNFLVDNMSKSEKSMNQNMAVTGSVERSIGDNDIVVFLPETTQIANENAMLKWTSKSEASSFKVKVTNLFDETVYSTTVDGNSATLNVKEMNVSPEEMYKLVVVNAADKSKRSAIVTLNVPSAEAMNQVNADVKELDASFNQETAIYAMVMATYFDKNGMYMNAVPFYEKAIELEPNIEEYRKAYNSFLYRMGM